MDCDDFCRQVADYYLSLPDMPTHISPADFQHLEDWWSLGIGVEEACEEIRDCLDRNRRVSVRWRPRRGLAYFTPAIEMRADQLAEWNAIAARDGA